MSAGGQLATWWSRASEMPVLTHVCGPPDALRPGTNTLLCSLAPVQERKKPKSARAQERKKMPVHTHVCGPLDALRPGTNTLLGSLAPVQERKKPKSARAQERKKPTTARAQVQFSRTSKITPATSHQFPKQAQIIKNNKPKQ